MSALAAPRRLTGARASALARCPRWAAFTAFGTEETPPTTEWRRYWDRGHVFEEYVYRQFVARYGAGAIEYQRVIPWGNDWEAHGDVYVRPERMFVEIKSTTVPGGYSSVVEDAIRQVRIQTYLDPEAEKGAVYLVNPSNLTREEQFVVLMTPEGIEEVEALIAQLMRAVTTKGDDLPECSCSTPTACKWKGCPFTEIAWEGWTPPPVQGLEAHRATVLGLAAAEQAVRNSTAITNEHKVKRDELRAQLRDELEPGVEYAEAGVTLKRIVVKPRRTFQWDRACKAGAVSEDGPLFDFLTVGAESDRWYVTGEGQAAPEDFGDLPF